MLAVLPSLFLPSSKVRKHIEGGTCLQYGARVLNEGEEWDKCGINVPQPANILSCLNTTPCMQAAFSLYPSSASQGGFWEGSGSGSGSAGYAFGSG